MFGFKNIEVIKFFHTNGGIRALTISNLASSAYGLSLNFLCKA